MLVTPRRQSGDQPALILCNLTRAAPGVQVD